MHAVDVIAAYANIRDWIFVVLFVYLYVIDSVPMSTTRLRAVRYTQHCTAISQNRPAVVTVEKRVQEGGAGTADHIHPKTIITDRGNSCITDCLSPGVAKKYVRTNTLVPSLFTQS